MQRNDAQEVFRKAHALGLTGADYLWLGVDAWMANPIYDDIEDADERAMLVEATQGAVGLLPDIKGSIYDDYVSNVWNGASSVPQLASASRRLTTRSLTTGGKKLACPKSDNGDPLVVPYPWSPTSSLATPLHGTDPGTRGGPRR